MRTCRRKRELQRNVLHIRGEDELKFDFIGEDWPNADLAVRSRCGGALIVGLPADKVKARDEREITRMKDLHLYSWVKEAYVPLANPSCSQVVHDGRKEVK